MCVSIHLVLQTPETIPVNATRSDGPPYHPELLLRLFRVDSAPLLISERCGKLLERRLSCFFIPQVSETQSVQVGRLPLSPDEEVGRSEFNRAQGMTVLSIMKMISRGGCAFLRMEAVPSGRRTGWIFAQLVTIIERQGIHWYAVESLLDRFNRKAHWGPVGRSWKL